MGRPRKDNGSPDEAGPAGPANNHNAIDAKVANRYVKKIERLKEDLASERGTYMAACKTIRASINNVLEEADANGLPRRELKAAIKARELEARADAIRSDLEEQDSIDLYDQIRTALGDYADTPLGAAALGSVDRPAA